MDYWARRVAVDLQKWLTSFDEAGACVRGTGKLRKLVVLASKDVVEPLRERGAFEGLRNLRDNHPGIQVEPTFLFEEIGADGLDEQIAWLSDAMSQMEDRRSNSTQVDVGQWTGEEWSCDGCGTVPDAATLTAVGDGVYRPKCHPRRCNRCGGWTHQTGLGSYPLCEGCQSEYGGMVDDPYNEPDGKQITVSASLDAESDSDYC